MTKRRDELDEDGVKDAARAANGGRRGSQGSDGERERTG
jgi:hypothetical protein